MAAPETAAKPRKRGPKPELSIFEEELNVSFNKEEFLPDLPLHARGQALDPSPAAEVLPAPISNATPTQKRVSNGYQTDSKVEPKLDQTGAKLEPNPGPNLSRSEVKVEPNLIKLSHPLTANLPKVEPQLRPKLEPLMSQSEAKVEPNQPLLALVGLQRNILSYIYGSCRAEGSKTSTPISIENLAHASGTTVGAARKAAQRLEGKGYVTRAHYKDGRGGWTQYAIPDNVYNALLLEETRAKVEPKLGQTRAKVETELEPQLRPSLSSSSSFLDLGNLKTTTTSEPELLKTGVVLSPEWEEVDLSIGEPFQFTRHQLFQIIRDGQLIPQEVGDSLRYFAFDFQKGRHKDKQSPLAYLMKILRAPSVYPRPEDYETPLEASRRKNLEALERAARKRQEDEHRFFEVALSEWKKGLSLTEILQLMPAYAQRPGDAQESLLKTHFQNEIWPARKLELFGSDVESSASDPTVSVEQIGKLIDQSLGGMNL